MNSHTTIKLELGIDARKIMQQVILDNHLLEEQILQGITSAIEEIQKDGGLVNVIKRAAVLELTDICSKHSFSWEIRNKISKLIEEKISKKIDEFAESIAEKITKDLK